MRAHATVRTAQRIGPGGDLHTYVSRLRSDAPLTLHPAIAKEAEPWVASAPHFARVSIAAGAAGPIGGDQLRLDVEVGAGSTLTLAEVSPSLLLPGPDGAQSRTDVRIRVESGATLVWLPEPLIAARHCHHLSDVRVELAEDARLIMREELLLGRHAERPGQVRQCVRVRRSGRPVYSQDLDLGAHHGVTPVVAAHRRAVGSILVLDPGWIDGDHQPVDVSADPHGEAALLPLAGGGVLISALASDSLVLRQQLAAGLALLGPPWDPRPRPGAVDARGGRRPRRGGSIAHHG